MSEPIQRTATYQDILALPKNLVGEILGGEMRAHPRPSPKHASASSVFGYTIGGPFGGGVGGPGGWWIIDEPEIHPVGDVIVPDIAGWRRARLPPLPETAWSDLARDGVSEILSPLTSRTDRAVKMPID